MSEPRIESSSDGRIRVSGELSFKTVPALVLESQDYFKNGNGLDVDLAGVSRADSAGVALLIEWQRQAQKQKKSISFYNIPSQMLAIARLSGVDELLSLKN
jgi:phospholipid transport system transporter-binding protein